VSRDQPLGAIQAAGDAEVPGLPRPEVHDAPGVPLVSVQPPPLAVVDGPGRDVGVGVAGEARGHLAGAVPEEGQAVFREARVPGGSPGMSRHGDLGDLVAVRRYPVESGATMRVLAGGRVTEGGDASGEDVGPPGLQRAGRVCEGRDAASRHHVEGGGVVVLELALRHPENDPRRGDHQPVDPGGADAAGQAQPLSEKRRQGHVLVHRPGGRVDAADGGRFPARR